MLRVKKIFLYCALLFASAAFTEQHEELVIEQAVFMEGECTAKLSGGYFSETIDIYAESFGCIQLSDQSIWEVHAIKIRDRTWSEWWNSIELPELDDCFVTEDHEWEEKTHVVLHPLDLNELGLNSDHIDHIESVLDCSHLLENKTHQKYLVGRRVQFSQVMDRIKKDYDATYRFGYSHGRANARSDRGNY